MYDDVVCKPIGFIKTCFKHKNGTPRQSAIAPTAEGIITIDKSVFNNPEHSLEELSKYSHVWILFHFHLNSGPCKKAKVKPPRMNGKRIGVFASRTMHRPNPIGLTLAKLKKVHNSSIHISGIDIVDGTPILDIKPYIATYDNPEYFNEKRIHNETIQEKKFSDDDSENLEFEQPCKKQCTDESSDLNNKTSDVTAPKWVNNVKPTVKVIFTERAIKNHDKNSKICKLVTDVLTADPRSVYRRNKCSDRLYFVTLDGHHITVWFDDDNIAEVLRIKPINKDDSNQESQTQNVSSAKDAKELVTRTAIFS